MNYHVPTDEKLLAAFGRVAICHGHLEYSLRMTIKTLADLNIFEALDATEFESPSALRRRINRLGRQRLREGQPLLKLQALLERCRRATDERNANIHSLWARDLDGEPQVRGRGHTWRTPPTVDQLDKLAQTLMALAKEINYVRLNDWLKEAVASTPR